MESSIEVYIEQADNGEPLVNLVLRNADIIEYETDELVPGIGLTTEQARGLIEGLLRKIHEIEDGV